MNELAKGYAGFLLTPDAGTFTGTFPFSEIPAADIPTTLK